METPLLPANSSSPIDLERALREDDIITALLARVVSNLKRTIAPTWNPALPLDLLAFRYKLTIPLNTGLRPAIRHWFHTSPGPTKEREKWAIQHFLIALWKSLHLDPDMMTAPSRSAVEFSERVLEALHQALEGYPESPALATLLLGELRAAPAMNQERPA